MLRKLLGLVWFIVSTCYKALLWLVYHVCRFVYLTTFLTFISSMWAFEHAGIYLNKCEDEFFEFLQGVEDYG